MVNMVAVNYGILLLNVLTGVYTARVMGPAHKGVYYAVMSWTGVAGTLALLGFPSALGWFYRQTPSPQLYRRMQRLTMASAALIALTMAVPVVLVVHHVSSSSVWIALVGMSIIPLTAEGAVAQMLLTLEGKFGIFNLVRIGQTAAFTAGVLILGLFSVLTPTHLLETAYLTTTLPALLFMVIAWTSIRRRKSLPPEGMPALKPIFRKAGEYFIPTLASTFNTRLDQMLNTIWLQASAIGLYGVALSSVNVGMVAMSAFSAVFFPSMVGASKPAIMARTESSVRLLLIASLIVCILAIAAVPVALPLLYGERYLGAYPIIIALLLSVPFMTTIGVLYQGFNALGRPILTLPSESVGAVSGAALLWILTPRIGAVGAGLSDSVSYGFDAAVAIWMWTRIGGRWQSLVPTPQDFSQLMALGCRYVLGALQAVNRRRGRYAAQLLHPTLPVSGCPTT
jgi:O-antigen/teichoic acid export membrane protein